MGPGVLPGMCLIGCVLFGWLVQFCWTFFEEEGPLDYLFPMQGDFQVVHVIWGEFFWEHVGDPCVKLYRKLIDLSVSDYFHQLRRQASAHLAAPWV